MSFECPERQPVGPTTPALYGRDRILHTARRFRAAGWITSLYAYPASHAPINKTALLSYLGVWQNSVTASS